MILLIRIFISYIYHTHKLYLFMKIYLNKNIMTCRNKTLTFCYLFSTFLRKTETMGDDS